MSKKKFLAALVIALLAAGLVAEPEVRGEPAGGDVLYFNHKGRDNIEAALSAAIAGGAGAESPAMAEVWLFRMMELLRYPELIEGVGDGARRVVESNAVAKADPFARARADIIRLDLLLRRGRIEEAGKLRKSLGFITRYRVIGPFAGSDHQHFIKSHRLEKELDFSARYEGSVSEVGWFPAETDLAGRMDLDQLFRGTRNSVYYLYASLDAGRGGAIHISLGKAGAAALWLDGREVFSNLGEHGFAFDQYRVALDLGPGRHGLLIKTAGSDEGCAVAVRVTDAAGNAVASSTEKGTAAPGALRVRDSGYFGALDYFVKKKDPSPRDRFLAGFLLYAAKLNSREGREAPAAFAKAREDPVLAPWARYYAGLCEGEAGAREHDLAGALELRDDFLEARAALAEHLLNQNLAFEAAPLVKAMSSRNNESILARRLEGELFLAKTWYLETEKAGRAMLGGKYPSAGHHLLGRVKKLQREYDEAAGHFEYLARTDRLDLDSLYSLAECRAKTGRYREAADALSSATAFFPGSVGLRLRLADMLDRQGGASASLAALSAANKISPSHPEVLLRLGETYHRLGKKDAAMQWFGEALRQDPQNFELARYYAYLYGKESELDRFLLKDDPADLAAAAERYRDEPVVVLLDETAWRLLGDGSYEKRVHTVYQVNQAGAIRDLSRLSIFISPETDRLESVRCAVINGTERVETSETRSQSLSDPESRLYYDMVAHVVNVPSLKPGSIISLRYSVKSRKVDDYAGYFGERAAAGGRYRVFKSNIVLAAPRDKDVYCHLKNIEGARLVKSVVNGLKVFRVRGDDIAPLLEETGMPHYSERLPTVTFTTHRNWDSMYRWYYGLLRNRLAPGSAMVRDLATIIDPGDSPRERVRKIFNHVTRRIRYVGFELGIGGIRPRSAGETYESGMGDCKDITLVLVALLRAAGIDARIALVRTADRGQPDMDVPWVGAFNHAICYVNIDGGFFLDGTAELSGYREIPEYDRNVPALVMDERGYRIVEVESALFERNLLGIDNEVTLAPDGSASLVRRFLKQGGMYAPAGRYSLQDEGGILKNISEFWNGAYPGSRISGFRVIENSLEKPVVYEYTVKVPSFGQVQDGLMSFKSMMIPTDAFRSYGSLRRRKTPLFLGGEFDSVETMWYRLPDGYEAHRVPENGKFGTERFGAECRGELKEKGRVIEVTHRVNYRLARVGVAEYEQFREMLKFINSMENETIILVKKGAAPGKGAR
jgi:tetratricopeptide (TPR) repeat protein